MEMVTLIGSGLMLEPILEATQVPVVGTYGFRDLIAILSPDFGFNWENGGLWI